jgi:hypothetical protein
VFPNVGQYNFGTGYYFLPLIIELFPCLLNVRIYPRIISSLKSPTDLVKLSIPCSVSLFSMSTFPETTLTS